MSQVPVRRGGKSPAAKVFEDEVVRIEILPAFCKDCGLCIEFCPEGEVLERGEGTVQVSNLTACTGCGQCELRCPDFAIRVTRKGTRKKQGAPTASTGDEGAS